MVNLTTSSNVAPAPASATFRFSKTCTAWALMSPAPTVLPMSSTATWPLMKTMVPPRAVVACVYMPNGLSPAGLMNFFVIVPSSKKIPSQLRGAEDAEVRKVQQTRDRTPPHDRIGAKRIARLQSPLYPAFLCVLSSPLCALCVNALELTCHFLCALCGKKTRSSIQDRDRFDLDQKFGCGEG